MNHQIDHCNADHRLAALRERLVVFGQAAVLAQPGKGALHDPAFGEDLEGVCHVAFDDLHEAARPAADPIDEFSGVRAIGEDQLHPPKARSQLADHQLAAVAILDVGRMHDQRDDQSERVDDQMTLATLDLLGRVEPAVPPFSAVLTDWLSMMPTLGLRVLPALRRTLARSRS